jgi:ABC-type phosphate transport system substrate-binding protein
MLERKLKTLAGACVAATAIAVLTASPASAAFKTAKCNGQTPLLARGATFQADAHTTWNKFYGDEEKGICKNDKVTYTGVGSGAGRTAFLERKFPEASFAGTDEAPSIGEAGKTAVNSTVFGLQEGKIGAEELKEGNSRLLVIPVTSAAVTVIVNTPSKCAVDSKIGGGQRPDRAAISKQEVEEIYRGAKSEWSELAPFDASDEDCQKPIKRVARQDSSGTTSQFKLWLYTLNSGAVSETKTWKDLALGGENTKWPSTVQKPKAAGGPAVAERVSTEGELEGGGTGGGEGSIGYVVLSDASPTFETEQEDTGEAGKEGKYWLAFNAKTGVGEGEAVQDPLVSPESKKSNCASASYAVLGGGAAPSTTWGEEADWSNVVGFNSNNAYAICSLSYVLAWHDTADVAVLNSNETESKDTEKRQRSTHDYIEYITSEKGQVSNLPPFYASLPESIRTTAEAGAKLICSEVALKETC